MTLFFGFPKGLAPLAKTADSAGAESAGVPKSRRGDSRAGFGVILPTTSSASTKTSAGRTSAKTAMTASRAGLGSNNGTGMGIKTV